MGWQGWLIALAFGCAGQVLVTPAMAQTSPYELPNYELPGPPPGPAPKTPAASRTALERWLPNSPDASWTYAWSNNRYAPAATLERYTVARSTSASVSLAWTTDDAGNGPGAVASNGTVDYVYADAGPANSNWASTLPPPQFPVLCASATQCGNSLAGAHYLLIWGSRSPLLQEPLQRGSVWTSLGGQANDVVSVNRFPRVERVATPAFPRGVFAARVDSDITQAGAIGDPFGSGRRTVWWVYGVGPVKIEFSHAGGETSRADLVATNLAPRTRPPDTAFLPLVQGRTLKFRYTNNRYMRKASRQDVTIAQVRNGTARLDVKQISGPIVVSGSYLLSTGRNGVRQVSATTSAATQVPFPELGPRTAPKRQRRHFFTPLDLLTFGYNPILPAYPAKGQTWKAPRTGRDRQLYGVTGTTKIIGYQRVRTRARTYRALLVESKMTQKGFKFGSGVRRAWFAPSIGLVKLVFRHRDGSVSTVERVP